MNKPVVVGAAAEVKELIEAIRNFGLSMRRGAPELQKYLIEDIELRINSLAASKAKPADVPVRQVTKQEDAMLSRAIRDSATVISGVTDAEVDWKAVGRIIETHSRLKGIHTAGTSNWGAAIYKAAIAATQSGVKCK